MSNRKMDANQPYCKTEINSILESIRQDDRLVNIYTALDVGCGSGESMKRLNREGFITVGCDISEEAVKYCRKSGLTAWLANGESLVIDFKSYGIDWKFDIVFSQHTMEHCEDWKSFINNCCTLSKKAVFITVPHDNMRDKTHVKKYLEENMDEVKEFIESKDFTIINGDWEFDFNKVGDKFLTVSYVIILKRKKS